MEGGRSPPRAAVRGPAPAPAGLADVVRGAGAVPAEPVVPPVLRQAPRGGSGGHRPAGRESVSARPPRYVRALVWDYAFTDAAERRRDGSWWRRAGPRLFLPAISLNRLGAGRRNIST